MGAVVATSVATTTMLAAGNSVTAPMVCSAGPTHQTFVATLTFPRSAAEGSTFTVRIDGLPSGPISSFGLNFIHDMETDYLVPAGATYVGGSAQLVPGTGTPNVTAGARVWYEAGLIKVALPGRVTSGSSYTPPSIEFQLRAAAAAGATLTFGFLEYRVAANAIVVGDVHATCKPTPRPYPLGTTQVTAAGAPN
jgi:hypothetical protein